VWETLKLIEFIDTHVANDPEWQQAYLEADATREAGRALVRARLAAGLTQQELALRSATAQAVISRIERGTVSPSLDTFGKIAKGLGMILVIGLEPAKIASVRTSTQSKSRVRKSSKTGHLNKSSRSRGAATKRPSSKSVSGGSVTAKS